MSRFLVTGGTGFIGRRLVRRLLADHGAQAIVCLVKAPVTAAEREAVERFRSSGVRLIAGDLLNEPVAIEPPPRVEVVFHLAANIATDAPEAELRVNDQGTRRLLDWISPVSRGTRIVYVSSVAVHDRQSEPKGPICETSPLTPRTAYGRTKLEGEHILRRRADADGCSWTVLRLPTVYGPGQKQDGLFDQLAKKSATGSLLARIDWPGRTSIIHVDDVVSVMIDLASRPDAAGEVFCVASDESLSVGELARRIGAFGGHPIRPLAVPNPLLSAARRLVWSPGVQRAMPEFASLAFWRLSLMISDGFWFDTAKFRAVYDKPLKTIEEGLRDL